VADVIPLLTGRTLGDTAFRWIVATLVLILVGSLAYGLVSGKFWAWRAHRAEDKAQQAADRAQTEAGNAQGARDASRNDAETRGRIDRIVVDVRDNTGQRAERIEAHAKPDAASGEPDPDVLRDIADGEAEYRAAAARLQRARSR
jgi:hypothetical protein